MNDEEMEIYCKTVMKEFNEWLKKINIMNTNIKDLLIESFFAGYECGSVTTNNKK